MEEEYEMQHYDFTISQLQEESKSVTCSIYKI